MFCVAETKTSTKTQHAGFAGAGFGLCWFFQEDTGVSMLTASSGPEELFLPAVQRSWACAANIAIKHSQHKIWKQETHELLSFIRSKSRAQLLGTRMWTLDHENHQLLCHCDVTLRFRCSIRWHVLRLFSKAFPPDSEQKHRLHVSLLVSVRSVDVSLVSQPQNIWTFASRPPLQSHFPCLRVLSSQKSCR